MPLGGLQHYTIEPADLERTKEFYCDVLGLENGDRPPLVVIFRLCTRQQPNPDKVMTRPYLGRDAVCISSILHDELKGRTAAAG